MDCLVPQQPMKVNGNTVGDTGITLDVGEEITAFVQANPIPTIGLAIAVGYIIYSLFKSK